MYFLDGSFGVRKAPPVPPSTVLLTAVETATPSPAPEIDPCDDPLNARKPNSRINPPKANNVVL
jgi:hypothetical protein